MPLATRLLRDSLRRPAAIAAVCVVVLAAVAEVSAAASTPTFGVYRGGGNVAGVSEFENWVGAEAAWTLDFLPFATWTDIESPTWAAGRWASTTYRTIYSVPLIPSTGGSLAAGAAGEYDEHFRLLAQRLVEAGEGDAVLRLGWEFNGSWYPWSAASDAAAFASYWRQVVTTMREVPGAAFRFDWCLVLGTGGVAAERAYPGDAYVDYIGLDAYDQDWYPGWQDPVQRWKNLVGQPHGLEWHRDFAAAHGKPMTFPEWGLTRREDGHGGGDNPYFIEQMHRWISANNVAYAAYFEFDASDGAHRLMTGQFPESAGRFLDLFRSNGAPAPPPPPSPPTPPPPPPPPPPAPTATPPAITVLPEISGSAVRNFSLSASTGTWAGSTPMTLMFQWLRCNTNGSACSQMKGATAQRYAVKAGDVGKTLRVRVTATNSSGSAAATSLATPPVRWLGVSSAGTYSVASRSSAASRRLNALLERVTRRLGV